MAATRPPWSDESEITSFNPVSVPDEPSLAAPQIISDEARDIIFWVVTCILCGIVSLFGIVTNSMNIAVFVSLGFNDTVNISLFGLAVSDLCSLVALLWIAICYNPEFRYEILPFFPIQVCHLTGGWPHAFFVRISGWIIAFVTFERFLCIALPLKVKNILTPKTVKVVIAAIYGLVLMSAAPIYYANRLEWVFIPFLNRSLVGITFSEDRVKVESVALPLNTVISAVASFCFVAVLTAALVKKLKEKSMLRKSMVTPADSNQDTLKTRDNKLARMMVAVSTIFIICLAPTVTNTLLMVLLPEVRQYRGLVFISFSFTFLLEAVNSSVNIFVYYHMSSRFKEGLDQLWKKLIPSPGKE